MGCCCKNYISNNEFIFLERLSHSYSSSSKNTEIILESVRLNEVENLSPDKKRCCICMEYFKKNDKIINLPCVHMFHNNCIRPWYNENYSCPICKNEG